MACVIPFPLFQAQPFDLQRINACTFSIFQRRLTYHSLVILDISFGASVVNINIFIYFRLILHFPSHKSYFCYIESQSITVLSKAGVILGIGSERYQIVYKYETSKICMVLYESFY